MNRDAPLTSRSYEYATPIRAGNLCFPTPGPNILKKKGILGKAGNYFSKEAKLELSLLLKISLEKIGNESNTRIFGENKFIWTWDEDTESDMLEFFRTEVEGMCRHTENEAMKTVDKRPYQNSHIGVCTRTECYDLLKAKDLIFKYLTASLSPRERDERYRLLLKKFPPAKEIVLFDPELAEYRHGQVLAGGINKKTMRHVGHSNGKIFWVFDIALQTSSKLEEIKNVLRPITLHAKRSTNERRFVLRYVASESKDTIRDWWKDVNMHVAGENNICYEEKIRKRCDPKSLIENLVEKKIAIPEAINCVLKNKAFIHKDDTLLTDAAPSAVEFSLESALTVDQLKTYLLPSKNSDATAKFLDSYLFTSTESEMDPSIVSSMNVLVEPHNIKGDIQDKYGFNTQTMVVQAITQSKVQGSLLDNYIPSSIKSIGLFKTVLDNIGLSSESELKRSFNLDKSYFFDQNGFTVSFSPATSSNFANSISLDGESASFKQIIVKVEDLTPTQKVDVFGYKFDRNFMENNIITDDVKACGQLHLQNCRDFFAKFHVSGTPQGKVLELFADAFFKNKGDINSSRLAGLRLANFLVKESTVKKCKITPCQKYYNEVIDLVYDCCKATSSPVIITIGLTILYRLLSVKKSNNVTNLKKKIVNKANVVFAKIVAEAIEANRATMVPVRVLEKALILLTKLADYEKVLIFSSTLKCIDYVTEKVNEVVEEKQRINVALTQALELKLEALTNTASFAMSKEKLESQQRIIEKIRSLEKKYESPKNKKESAEKEQITSVAFNVHSVPYFTHNGVWDKTTYNVDTKEFILQHPTKRVKATLSGLKGYTLSELSKYGDVTRVSLVNTGNEVTEAKVFLEEVKSLASTELSEVINQKLTNEAKSLKHRVVSLIYLCRQVRVSLSQLAEPKHTKVTLTAAASPEQLYGKSTISAQPSIGKNWATSLFDGLNKGLNSYHSSITSDLVELDLKS